ncbi:MAG: c-type cytochrome [Alphaproteobacteria bacterium]|nr:c-type cytochrome [Alphaproteobacteria bacterium]
MPMTRTAADSDGATRRRRRGRLLVWWHVAAAAAVVVVGSVAIQHALPAGRAWAPASFDLAAAKADYRRPPPLTVANPALVELGRVLFWDPRLSATGQTSCVSCHQPHLGWASTDARSRSDSGLPMPRKAQPLIGIGYAADLPGGWDGRLLSLRAHVRASLTVGAMSTGPIGKPVPLPAIEARMRAIPEYLPLFAAALPGTPPGLEAIAQAINAYARTFEPGVAPFDRWIKGDEDAISASAKRGFVLFNTKGNCAVCHRDWRFTDDNFHDIGLPGDDRGRGQLLHDVAAMQFAFKTPTLRSVALRAPYMHDGSLDSLYDVVRFYDSGGINRPSRVGGASPLHLSEQERLDLVAFLRTLTGEREGESAPRPAGRT